MPKSEKQKLKLLYLAQMFYELTDENHVLTMPDIISGLAANGIKAERKSIYDDIEALRTFGMDIVHVTSVPKGYCLIERKFELAELKLLVDSVQASRFVTRRKTENLIKKLGSLVSKYDAGKLVRQVYVLNRIKSPNEQIYYSIDNIYEAVNANRQISFFYNKWTPGKELISRRDGKRYIVSPYALSWDDENYYMVGYDSEAEVIKHYRVDKMDKTQIEETARCGMEQFSEFDIAEYCKGRFGMYSGIETMVSIEFDNILCGVVIDKFGQEIMMYPTDEEHFHAVLPVKVSNQFYGWLCGLGPSFTIKKPEHIAEEYRNYLESLLEKTK